MTERTTLTPRLMRIPAACARYGLSRSYIYREAAKKNIRLVKAGRTTLVDVASLDALADSLPEAAIRLSRAAA